MKRSLLSLLLLLALHTIIWGQAIGDYQSNAVTMNWNTTANWQRWDGIQWVANPAQGYPGQNAGTGLVTIRNGHTVTHNVNIANPIGALTVENGASLSVGGFNLTVNGATTVGGGTSGTLNITSALGTKSFFGLVTVNSGATWNNIANEALEFRGGVTNNGTFTAGTGVHTFTTNAQALSGSLSIPNVTVIGITLTNNNNLTVGTALAGTGGLTQTSNAVLNLGGTATITTLTATANPNLVEYNGAAQTLKVTAYHHLTFSGSGAKTLGAVTTVAGDVIVNGTATATTGAALTIGGNLEVNTGAAFATGNTNTWTLSVAGITAISGTLTLANTGAKTFTGDVTINNGGTWNETGNAPINYTSNLQNDGIYTANNGIHTFSGTATTISGANVVTIPNLTITGTTTNDGTLTVSTALAGTGTLTNGVNATLNISGTSLITGLSATNNPNIVNYNGTAQTVKAGVYHNLILSNNNTKTFAGAITINGNFSMTGTAVANLGTGLTHTANSITLGGVDRVSGSWGSTASAALNKNATFFGLTATGILNVNTCNPGLWTGAVSTDWNTAGNWCGGAVPTSVTNVLIPSGTPIPSIGALGGLCNNITINAGATLVITGTNTLTVSSNWTNNGTFTINNSTVIFNGTSQISGTATFFNLTTTGMGAVTTATPVTVNGSLSIGAGSAFSTGATNTWTLTVTGTTSVSGTLTLANTGIKTFTGNVTISNTGTWNETGAAAVNYAGNLQNDGSYTASMGVHTFSGAAVKTISGANGIVIPNLTISGATTNNGTLTVSAALAGGSTLTNGATGTLNYGGAGAIAPTLTATAVGNTVNYNGAAQAVKNTAYYNLTLSGSGTKTITGISAINNDFTLNGTAATTPTVALTIGGNVTMASGTSFTSGNFTHNVAGNWTNNGGIFTPGTGTINFNGGGARFINGTANTQIFNNLTINKTGGSLNVSGGTTIVSMNGGVTLTAGTFNAGTAVMINVAGNWTNNATFTPGIGSVTFNGVTQVIGGTTPTIFNNLIIGNSSTTTPSINLSVNSDLVCSGIFDLTTFTCNRNTVGGTLAVIGTLRLRGTGGGEAGSNFPANFTTYNLTNGTVEYNSIVTTSQTIFATPAYGNLTLSRFSGGAATLKTAGGNLTIAGNLLISAGVTFVGGAFTHTIGGNWTNNGAFTSAGNSVNFNGSTQTIGGSTATTFNNISINSSTSTQINTTAAINGVLSVPASRLLIIGGVTVTLAASGNGTIDGVLRNNQNARLLTNNNLLISGIGKYQHDWQTIEGFIPFATWADGSVCEIIGFTGDNSPNTFGAANGYSQSFYDFVWNCPNQGAGNIITMSGSLTTIRNDMTILTTGNGIFRLSYNSAGNLTIGRNFLQQAGSFELTSVVDRDVTIGGNFTLNGGNINLSDATNRARVLIAGNFTQSTGTVINELGTSNTSGFIFNGSGTPQIFTSGGTINNIVNFIVNTGAFLQMAAGTTTVTGGGAFTLQGGATLGVRATDGIAVTGATGNIRVTGTRTYTTGANYVYNGTANQITGLGLTQNIPANLTIDNPSNTVSLSAATTISSNLLINAGNFSSSASNFNFTLGGNWTNNSVYTPNTNTVTFNSTTQAQTIGGTVNTTFYNLTNTNTNATGLSLNDVDATVTNILNLNSASNGKFTIGANNLTIGSGGTISNAGATKYIVTIPTTSTNGRLRQNNLGTSSRTFPIGTAVFYLPSTITPALIGSDFSISVFRSTTTDGLPGGSPFSPRTHQVDAVWWIGQPVGAANATVRFNWQTNTLEGSVFTTQPDSRIAIWRKDNPTISFWRLAATGFNNDNNANYSEGVTVTDFGSATGYPYIVATNFVLPVSLKSFAGVVVNGGNLLKWEFQNSEVIKNFEVERSFNAVEFNSIGSVMPSASAFYNFFDYTASDRTIFYRLKMMDLLGSVTYSHVISIGNSKETQLVLLQNPVQQQLVFRHPAAQHASFRIIDFAGRIVKLGSLGSNAVISSINVSDLVPGTYQIQFIGQQEILSKLFIKH